MKLRNISGRILVLNNERVFEFGEIEVADDCIYNSNDWKVVEEPTKKTNKIKGE